MNTQKAIEAMSKSTLDTQAEEWIAAQLERISSLTAQQGQALEKWGQAIRDRDEMKRKLSLAEAKLVEIMEALDANSTDEAMAKIKRLVKTSKK